MRFVCGLGYEKKLFEEAVKVLTHYSTVFVKLPYPFFSIEQWHVEVVLEEFRYAKWDGLSEDGKTKTWDYDGYRGRFSGFDLKRKAFCCELDHDYEGASTDRKQFFFDIRNEPVAQAMNAWKPWEDAYAMTLAIHKKTKKWDNELLDEMKEAYEKWAVLAIVSPQIEVVDPANEDTPFYGNTDLESIENFDFVNFIQDAELVTRAPVSTGTSTVAVAMAAMLTSRDAELWKSAKTLSQKYTSFVQRKFVEQGWKHSGEMAVHDARAILSYPFVQALLCHDLMNDDAWEQRFNKAPRPESTLSDMAASAIGLVRSDAGGRRQDRLRETASTTAAKLWKSISDFNNEPQNILTGTDLNIEAIEALDMYHTNIDNFINVQGFIMRQKLNQLLSSTGYIPGDPTEFEQEDDEENEGDDLREERDSAKTPASIAAALKLRALQSLDTNVVDAKNELVDSEEAHVIDPTNEEDKAAFGLAKKAVSDAEVAFSNALHTFTLDDLRNIISLPRLGSSYKPDESKATLEKRIHDLIKRKRDDDSEAGSGSSGSATGSSSMQEADGDAHMDDASTEDNDGEVCNSMQKLKDAIKVGSGLQGLARWIQKWLLKADPTMNLNANLKKEKLSDGDTYVFLYRECHSLYANASNLKRHEAFFKSFMHLWCFQHTVFPTAEKIAIIAGPGGGSLGWVSQQVTYTLKEHKGVVRAVTVPIVSAVQQLVTELTTELDAANPKSLVYFVDDPKGITARLNTEGERDSFKTAVTPQTTQAILEFVKTENPALLPDPRRRSAAAALLSAGAAPAMALTAPAAAQAAAPPMPPTAFMEGLVGELDDE